MKTFRFPWSRKWAIALGLAFLSGAMWTFQGGATRAEDKPKEGDSASIWMKKKTEHSHRVFDGVATGDFEQIQDAAEHLRALNRVEEFVRGRTPAYRRQLENFQEANEELIRQAEAKNLEGATLALTQMTYACVNCHKQLRK